MEKKIDFFSVVKYCILNKQFYIEKYALNYIKYNL